MSKSKDVVERRVSDGSLAHSSFHILALALPTRGLRSSLHRMAGDPINQSVPKVAGWRVKLFTSHDRQHMHKILGTGALLHFIGRFLFVGVQDMGFKGDNFTAFSLGWHLCLSLSSFIFRLPAKRLMVKGSEGR